MSLEDIAIRDRIHEFPVKQVLQHRFKETSDGIARTRSSDLEFLIKWCGFSKKWNSWEPFKNVRLNESVVNYLKDHRLKRFIPRNLETDPVINHVVTFESFNSLKRGREGKEFVQEKKGKWRKHKDVSRNVWIPCY